MPDSTPAPDSSPCSGNPSASEQARLKRAIYEKISPRRRKFIDRMGYDNWDPFQKPNDPLDLREDVSRRTVQQLMQNFRQHAGKKAEETAYMQGATEAAVGMVNKDARCRGFFDFCLWYRDLLVKEGLLLP